MSKLKKGTAFDRVDTGLTCGCGNADDLCVAGSQFSSDRLVIGLNPPFGKNASLANEFVSYAVDKFQPRMLVLIVPKITKVLERNDADNGVVHDVIGAL